MNILVNTKDSQAEISVEFERDLLSERIKAGVDTCASSLLHLL